MLDTIKITDRAIALYAKIQESDLDQDLIEDLGEVLLEYQSAILKLKQEIVKLLKEVL